MLYWAEGSKLRNSLEIANSDFNLLAFFMSFLRQEFPHYENAIAPRLNVYTGNGLAIEEVEEEWLTRLSLPRKSLRKHTINNRPAGRGGVRKNKLPYGVATLSLNRTHAVQHVWGAIQAYGDFDDPKYLDI